MNRKTVAIPGLPFLDQVELLIGLFGVRVVQGCHWILTPCSAARDPLPLLFATHSTGIHNKRVSSTRARRPLPLPFEMQAVGTSLTHLVVVTGS
jgi:hypothetical protein